MNMRNNRNNIRFSRRFYCFQTFLVIPKELKHRLWFYIGSFIRKIIYHLIKNKYKIKPKIACNILYILF